MPRVNHGAGVPAAIPAATRMGAVHLEVADLARSIAYYERGIGLRVQHREHDRVALGAGGEDLLVLHELPGARPSRGWCGLYHFALLVPERSDLAVWFAHAVRQRVPLVGASDHFVSEALYLSDPDEHGIEIYWDRPRELWEGVVAERMTTLPLDLQGLLAEQGDEAAFEGISPGTVVGHVHLRVAELAATTAFYRDLLGFATMATFGGQAAFLSAGGYHHHIGANTWESAGRGQPPPGTATLKLATVLLPDLAELQQLVDRIADAGAEPAALPDGALVRDPSGNQILLAAAGLDR